MLETPATFWSRSHFKTYSKSDLQVNNMCITFKRAIFDHMDNTIITLLEVIKYYIAKMITTRKDLCIGTMEICPRI